MTKISCPFCQRFMVVITHPLGAHMAHQSLEKHLLRHVEEMQDVPRKLCEHCARYELRCDHAPCMQVDPPCECKCQFKRGR